MHGGYVETRMSRAKLLQSGNYAIQSDLSIRDLYLRGTSL